jgi:hypothetical protein
MENLEKNKIEQITKILQQAHFFYLKKSKVYQAFEKMEKVTYADGKLNKLQKELIAVGICISFMVMTGCGTLPNKSGVPVPQELKKLAEGLPPYSQERDCGFEALSVFEKFGGDIVIAQQGFIDDGIYSVNKTIVPADLAELVGPSAHGIFSWKGVWYIYYAGFGCYELSPVRKLKIIEHRGINMKQNGPHVWNIINGVVIDISWSRQNMETFLDTVITQKDRI